MYDVRALNELVAKESAFVDKVMNEVGKVIVGQTYMLERILIGLLTGGHVLLEGVPGLAKTLTVRTLCDAISAKFARIQFTPDLLPADVIGTVVYNQQRGEFTSKLGPVFANLVLADEINRAPAKVQSALLEAMQERHVTIGAETHALPDPFLVLATQNPIEQEGTYRLPEAQQDRFMLKVRVPLPSVAELIEIMERFSSKDNQPKADKVFSLAELDDLRKLSDKVYVDPSIKEYIAHLVDATTHPENYGVAIPKGAIENDGGTGPRGAIYLIKAARIHALMNGRAYVGPDDVAAVAHRVLRHRVILGFSAPRDLTTDKVVDALLAQVPVPAPR